MYSIDQGDSTKAFIMLQTIYILNNCCSFELFLWKESWKKCIMVYTKNIMQNDCFQHRL